MLYPAAAYMWTDPHHHASKQQTMIPPAYPPVPHQYHHDCCNHPPYYYYYYYYGGAPTYSFQPHYTPFHPPHGVFPAPYSLPPQHYYNYSVEQPRYDKNNNHHCPGCNHQERPREPQVDNKPSLPLLLKDRPIMWIPTESKADDKDKYYSHESSKQGGNGKDEQQQGRQFPFQIFWLPSQVGKENNLDLGLSEEDDKITKNNEEKGECSKHSTAQKVSTTNEQTHASVQKVIPVKQAKSIGGGGGTMVNSNSGNRASSKLPPVCLRIDPLPKKKTKSSSPSPSRSPVNTPKSSQQVLKKEEQSEGDIKTKTIDHANKATDVPRDESDKGKVEESMSDETKKGKVEKKKKLSEHEAALIIQSVYRGFEVRKSQPLKKLRLIFQVKKQVFDLRNHIQDLETSIRIDSKKQAIIGETIMSLLLKLDTIQGLHPFVREVRKSVAKELVGLQEKLDSLTTSEGSCPQPEDDDAAAAAIMQQGKLDQTRENKGAVESQYNTDDAEAQQQLEKRTATHDEAPAESDTATVTGEESHKEKIDEALGVESHKEESKLPTDMEAEPLQKEKSDECEVGLCDTTAAGEEASRECDEVKASGCIDEEAPLEELVEGCAGESQLESDECSDHRTNEAAAAALELLCENYEATADGGDDMKLEDKKNQPPVESEDDLVKVEESSSIMMQQQQQQHDDKNEEDSSMIVSEAGLVMEEEENEKLRAAVKELMKAGKEQLDVIKELTARLKDLEKKLHSKNKKKKKKKVKVNKCSRRSRDMLV